MAVKIKGLGSLYQDIIDNIWAAAAHTEGHITRELERLMGTLSDSVTRLSEAIANEFDDIKAAAEATLAELREALAAADADNEALTEALNDQISANEDLVRQIDEAKARLDALSSELEENDQTEEVPEDPNAPHVDHTLPGDLPANPDDEPHVEHRGRR